VYALREALLAIFRHPVSSLATLTTAAVSFTLLLLVGLSLWNLDRVIGAAEGELEIAVFLKPGADLATTTAAVRRMAQVARVRAIPRDQALKELIATDPYLRGAADLVQNPLPDTLIVTPKTPAAVAPLAAALQTLPGVDQVEYGGRLTLELLRVARGVRVGALLLILMLILNTFFSVMGTIRLSIENRKDELEVMQLVGASRGTILLPFVAEGFLLTLTAALVALLIAIPGYRYLAGELKNFFPFLPTLEPGDLATAAYALLVLAFLLGTVGGWLSSRAHLKEVTG